MVGYTAAFFAGVFSTLQYVLIEAGQHYEQTRHDCRGDKDSCPAVLKEQFNNFGSWMASFGVGAAMVTLYVAVLAAVRRARGEALPPFHFRVFRGPGSVAGILWCLGSFGNTAAVQYAGIATTGPTSLAVSIVTSGAFGVFYYREVRGWRAVVWAAAAMWTLSAVLLLSFEKG